MCRMQCEPVKVSLHVAPGDPALESSLTVVEMIAATIIWCLLMLYSMDHHTDANPISLYKHYTKRDP